MTKRSRKSAFGKAGVLRRSSLKTIPVLAIDPLSTDYSSQRKTVRTTLLVGTAMGASLLTIMALDTQSAYAAAGNCNFVVGDLAEYCGGGGFLQVPFGNGINFTSPTDLTIVVGENPTAGTLDPATVGSNINGDGVTLTADNSGITLSVVGDNNSTFGTTSGYAISRDGIHVFSSHYYYNNRIVVKNNAPIGPFVTRDGIHAVVINGGSYYNDGNGNTYYGTSGSVLVTNTGVIQAGRDGIHAGGVVFNTGPYSGTMITTIKNLPGGSISAVSGEGIDGFARVNEEHSGYNAQGGHGTAITNITNSPPIIASGDAIHGSSNVNSDGVGLFTHPSSVTLTGGSGVGGVAVAALSIGNGTADALSSSNGEGIDGSSLASAEGWGFTAAGGQANATTSVTNSSTINSYRDGILGTARADADAHGSYFSNTWGAGSATGGVANAAVVISNSGNITADRAEGIDGSSRATATAGWVIPGNHSYNAVGGTAIASTIISNAGEIWLTVDGHARDGIQGRAEATANAYGENDGVKALGGGLYGSGGYARGGVAIATVAITNNNTIFSMERQGIDGRSSAEANAGGQGNAFITGLPKYAYTAVGGQATATTVITNTKAIITEKEDIIGRASASANAFGGPNFHGTYGPGGSAHGGVAIASVIISNSGTLYNTGGRFGSAAGIDGGASASANAFGATAVGGFAQATTTIVNAPQILVGTYGGNGDGIVGTANASANAFGSSYSNVTLGIFGSATGGVAIADVSITNGTADNITSGFGMGIDGESRASANAGSWSSRSYFAFGGSAQALTTITNSSAITSFGDSLRGRADASANAFGSNSFYSGTPSNAGTATTYTPCGPNEDPNLPGCVTTNAGTPATPAIAAGPGGFATGGFALAGVFISNSGSLLSSYRGEGIDGRSSASANAFGFRAYGGQAFATTTIVNLPPIISSGDSITGRAEASANAGASSGAVAAGGVAVAGVFITNGTADALSSINGEGIDGRSRASANAGSWRHRSYSATGGFAEATTTIINGSSITSSGDGITGRAEAAANAFATYSKGANATGGYAVAGVFITNAGSINTPTAGNGGGIDGRSSASANAFGFTAIGGTAFASTTIVNAPPITVGGDGIHGSAEASANAHGSSVLGGFAQGGTAVAAVLITNGTADAIFSKNGEGIEGRSSAEANAGSRHHESFTAIGGSAQATTTIINGSGITSYHDDITGRAEASANAFGSFNTYGTAGQGSATGGLAIAAVFISNSGSLYNTVSSGIDGRSSASANARGFTAIGGTAHATTTIINTPQILASQFGPHGDGIEGRADASANAFGADYSNVTLGIFGSATGGVATANLFISNGTADYINAGSGEGIDGRSSAEANAGGRLGSHWNHPYFAFGGAAVAYTTIVNGSAISSSGDGITGRADADANALGSNNQYAGKPAVPDQPCEDPQHPNFPGCIVPGTPAVPAGPGGLASGGLAIASVTITNSNTINSGDEGIDGQASASANARAFRAYGGHAYATTTIVNTPAITSVGDGIRGRAEASANAYGSYSKGGIASGGVAIAGVFISNGTADNIQSFNGEGIDGQSSASANAGSGSSASWQHRAFTAIAGHAQAFTFITNSSGITSSGDGITGGAEAAANAFGSYGAGGSATGGVARAGVVISNAGAISSSDEGLDGHSSASANASGYTATGGTAFATTTIINVPTITSTGDAIVGNAEASANAIGSSSKGGFATGGVAIADLLITNGTADKIYSGSEGIDGRSSAEANAGSSSNNTFTAIAGHAQATTTIFNGSAIGSVNDGIKGRADADANAHGVDGPGSVASGGVAFATVFISNANTITVSDDGEGIDGRSSASANAFGFSAFGGTAFAGTTIVNVPAIYTANGDGIKGGADASANAFGGSSDGGFAQGGVAIADLLITNGTADQIFSKEKEGIDGSSRASANAGSWGNRSFTAIGGHAQATTTIINGSAILSEKDDITGRATASASAFGSDTSDTYAKGGVAFASVLISNAGSLYNTRGEGIDGQSSAKANAVGNFAYGGTAFANTVIVNVPAITSNGDGIKGTAEASANAIGSHGTIGSGGVAIAGVVITNGTADAIFSKEKEGIDGQSSASANAGRAGSFSHRFYKAIGGYALATTTIINGSALTSEGDGIHGSASASADAFGSNHIEITGLPHHSDDPILPGSIGVGPGGYAKGGVAIASVLISNSSSVYTTIGDGLDGRSSASANATGFTAIGGTAQATTTIISTPGILASQLGGHGDGIHGSARASANAYGSKYSNAPLGVAGSATGGLAIANVLIPNGFTDPINSGNGDGIDGRSSASANAGGRSWRHRSYTAVAGTAMAATTILNGSAITSSGDGITGSAKASANAYGSNWIYDPVAHNFSDDPVDPNSPNGVRGPGGSATGGLAVAVVSISNAGTINSGNDGLEGRSSAAANASGYTAIGGTAMAYTTIFNAPPITSGGDGIKGKAEASANAAGKYYAKGGTALASVVITNGTADAIHSYFGEGIDGSSRASANAGSWGHGSFTAIGGLAIATTSITNGSPIKSYEDGIKGRAEASASAHGVDSKGSSATGGQAIAAVVISNAGTILSLDGEGIDGQSSASANASGFKAYGGTAQATTLIVNVPSIVSSGDGIKGKAEASANAFGSSSPGGFASGGLAIANVLITNGTADAITSSNGEGIDGSSRASANAGSWGNRSYTAIGGRAYATTSITNSSAIKSDKDGIEGRAEASANAFGSNEILDPATGGHAVAAVVISNAGAISGGKEGIDGQSSASANAVGFKAFGGTAQATTLIVNTGPIGAYSGDGIDGFAKARANARGEDEIGGFATGGLAIANVLITNSNSVQSTGEKWENYNGTGIAGSTLAQANAGGFRGWQPHGESSFVAIGGSAIAGTVISNTGYIHAAQGHYLVCSGEGEGRTCSLSNVAGDGIDGFATADAEAHGTNKFGGSAAGGLAQASVLISNLFAGSGPGIVAYYGNGILGQSVASADAFGFNARGGTAFADTTIINNAIIQSDDGIDGFAKAFALGVGSNKADPGLGSGGTAVAHVLITNSGNIISSGGGTAALGIGIDGTSLAVADAKGRQAFGGHAYATTVITNTGGSIKSGGDGIQGNATASANATGKYGTAGYAKGGIAKASVTVNNTATIASLRGDGINVNTNVSANGYLCTKDCDNDDPLSLYGKGLGGSAVAITAITNTGNITSKFDGIRGVASASANGTRIGGYAVASTTITNTGKILVKGTNSEGIDARSSASANGTGNFSTGGTAMAFTLVINKSGARGVYNIGDGGFGILATSSASANGVLRGGTAIAQTIVTNAGELVVVDDPAGIQAGSTANANGPGGSAFASTNVYNSFKIVTEDDNQTGIDAYAFANAKKGTIAQAITHVSNSSVILTQGDDSPGIVAASSALAGNLRTGKAVAGAYVTNNGGVIGTLGDDSAGISAFSSAYAGGTAIAVSKVFITNSTISTKGDRSAGISAHALAGGYYSKPFYTTAGRAYAYMLVSNQHTMITTNEHKSPGVEAKSYANGYYAGTATTVVSNNGSIFTNDRESPGINADSSATAAGVGGTAIAFTGVGNWDKIITDGRESAGIKARSDALGDASAVTIVNNYSTGVIITYQKESPGIDASSSTTAVVGNATAHTLIGNAGSITTNGDRSTGVRGKAYAYALLGAADALATFTNGTNATVTTYDDHSDGVSLSAFAKALGNANATVAASVINGGAIVTYGKESTGIELYAGAVSGAGTPSANGSVQNWGSVVTHGRESDAIKCTAVGDSSCNVTNIAAFIQTYGDHSEALDLRVTDTTPNPVEGASITVSNLGDGANPSSIKTSGDHSDAVKATVNGAKGTINIYNSGSIWTYGNHSEAIDATVNGINGYIIVRNAGTILTGSPDDPHSGKKSDAISAIVGINGSILIANNGGTVSTYGKKSDAINVAVLGGVKGSININNLTTLTSTTNNGVVTTTTNVGTIAAYNTGYHAVVATGAPVTLSSSGYIFGNVQLSATNDTFTNAGKWTMAGNSNFGRGTDVVSNSGIVTMLSGSNGSSSSSSGDHKHGDHSGRDHVITPSVLAVAGARYSNIGGQQTYYRYGPLVSGNSFGHHKHGDTNNLFYTVFLSNLETFVNSGLVDMRDGHPNQQIVVSGNFVGLGGTLGVDAYLGGHRNPNCVVCEPNKSDSGSGGSSVGQQQQQQQQQQIIINVTVNGYGFSGTSTTTSNTSGSSGSSDHGHDHGKSHGSATSNLGSDLLTIGGNMSGTTYIAVHDTNPGLGAYDPIGIPVIIVGGNIVDGTKVQLAGGPIIKGLFDYDVYLAGGKYDPVTKSWSEADPLLSNSNKNIWVLASTPNQAANELPRLRRAVDDVWQQASGTWADRSADLRGYFYTAPPQPACDPRLITKAPCYAAPAPSNIGPGVWARAFGDWSHNGATADETLYGKTHSYDVSYHQDIFGVQAGFDFAAQKTGYENFIFGFLAGAVDSKVNFASGTGVKLSGGNIGVYATLINHGLFADALLLANFMTMNYDHSQALQDNSSTVVTFGGHLDMGYRFNFGGYAAQPTYDMYTKAPHPAPSRWTWFFEPLATLEGMVTTFRSFDLPGVSNLDLNPDKVDLRSRLGARIGTTIVKHGLQFEPSLTAGVWHNFSGYNTVDFTSDCYTLNLQDANAHLTYGEVGLALNVLDLGSRWSAFLKGDYRFAHDYNGGGVKGGFRFQW